MSKKNVKTAREAFCDKRIKNAQSMIEAKNDERNKIILAVEGEGGIREMLGKIKNEYLKLQGEEVKKDQYNTITNENSSEIKVDKSSINSEELNKNKIYAEFMQKLVDREKGSIEKGSTELKEKKKLGANWTNEVTYEYKYLYKEVKQEAKKEKKKLEKKSEKKSFFKGLNMDFKLTFNKEKSEEKTSGSTSN